MASSRPAGKQEEGKGAPDKQAAAPAGKKSRSTLLVILGVLLLAGGGGAVGGVLLLHRGPAKASAEPVSSEIKPAIGEDVEELLVEGKAPNLKKGSTYMYKFKVIAVLAKGDVAAIKSTLEKRKAAVDDTVRQSIARLEPRDLDEDPELGALRRVLLAEFEKIFGPDKIKQLIIPVWDRLRLD